jgi:hypothetical protein
MAIQIRLIKSQIVEFKSDVDIDDAVLAEILRRIQRMDSSGDALGSLQSMIERVVQDHIEDYKNSEKMTVERFHSDSEILDIYDYDQERLTQSFEIKRSQGNISAFSTHDFEEVLNQINAISFKNPESSDLSISESCDQGSNCSNMERVLESFNGYVERIDGATAYVRL